MPDTNIVTNKTIGHETESPLSWAVWWACTSSDISKLSLGVGPVIANHSRVPSQLVKMFTPININAVLKTKLVP